MPDQNHFPPVPLELLKRLDELYPERSADLSWSDREVWARAGERRVIRKLWAEYEEQNEVILNTRIAP